MAWTSARYREQRLAKLADAADLTADRLRQAIDYDPLTGLFTWRHRPEKGLAWNNTYPGKPAGTMHSRGYIRICLDYRVYAAHRLAWLHVTGLWPKHGVDHIDGVRDNNRFANLRDATQFQNTKNRRRSHANTSGYKGVFWHAGARKWMAQIMVDGKGHYLGLFTDPKLASDAYNEAAARLFGDFARPEEPIEPNESRSPGDT